MPVGPHIIGRLFDAHANVLALYARQLCDDPEDIVQQAFLKLAAQHVAPDNPVRWLFRVVRNAAIAAARSGQRRQRREREVVAQRGDYFCPSADDRIDAALATAALRALPHEQREIVTMRIWGALSFQDIGELLAMSDSTAHRRYRQALDMLRQQLGEPCPQKN